MVGIGQSAESKETPGSNGRNGLKMLVKSVAVLPLSAESRSNFDGKKAADYFKSLEGIVYII
jgi:hypothetical protein